jgi:hypothetical protein
MTLSVRPTPYIIPAYSLTGDLLAYLRCGLQYRYQHRGTLPPSKPVQRWFGEFLHGVMEEAYRQWTVAPLPFPVSDSYLLSIEQLIIERLGARGIWPRNQAICDLRARAAGTLVDDLAHRRARASVNIWGPHLFPLIAQAEVRLKGIREMPGSVAIARADYYEVQGIVDVLTSVELSTADPTNRLLLEIRGDPAVARALGQVIAQQNTANSSKCEIIVDYKGMRRPSYKDDPTAEHIYWQILTYAWLRGQQPEASPVVGGVLLFLNELEPSRDDMEELCGELFGPGAPRTDVIPLGTDLANLRAWYGRRYQGTPPTLSLDYRIKRSIRVVSVSSTEVQRSLQAFDLTVAEIETSVAEESSGRLLTACWRNRQSTTPDPKDQTCAVCDFRTYCPASPRKGAPLAP